MVVMIPTSIDPRTTGRQPKRRSTISLAALCARVSGVTERTRRVMTSPTFTCAAADKPLSLDDREVADLIGMK
jgi:hypothetical protein